MRKNSRVLLVAFLAIVGSTPVASQQKPVPPSKPNQQQAQPDRRGTLDSPLIVKMVNPEDAKQRAEQAAEERKRKESVDDAIVTANRGLVWIGVFQVILFLGQLRMMWLAQDTTKRQLRAYVTVQGVTVKVQRIDDKVWLHMEVQFFNTGQTPAYQVICGSRGAILPAPLPKKSDLTVIPNQTEISSQTLGTGQGSMTRPGVGPITPDEWGDLVHQRGNAFYAYGHITYRDIFDKPHYTNFCSFALWTGGGPEVLPHIADQHNDAN